jgi:hypothetical protein
MKRLLIVLALAIAPVLAQPKPEDHVQRLVRLKYAEPARVVSLLRNFPVYMIPDDKMMVISISGNRGAVDTAEAAIKELDGPGAAQKDVEMTVFFVVGTDEPAANAAGSPIPKEIESTVAALKQTFPYKTYALLDALSLRSRAGAGAHTEGQLGGGRSTDFGVRSVSVEPDGTMIRLDHLAARLRVPKMVAPNKTEMLDSGISTDILDVKEGQKLVVGRSSLEGPAKALFLVLIARVAQ